MKYAGSACRSAFIATESIAPARRQSTSAPVAHEDEQRRHARYNERATATVELRGVEVQRIAHMQRPRLCIKRFVTLNCG
jgi:hypothetical protein